ncbi:hypothetical protein A2303_05780 [Candidatus Falkowbacteria bacterium RIFOXYB2_FULL_47_14]|uniref:Uncharacterized protein n=1 Tax=Candidatus Falkowbacteria bacterium RIFOXYA2_FULL_47_19 TaxID=1797994 RepID=A0A1F5SEH3_9BACT|nr:MAG: hypothetical protein A2227_07180 [Candidatus Falkowbacteria bacterium RIFOXYA2_FULL_47_19]OGF35354.1 MAG: hypothetical protein A2468_00330 [Candidatus Falkowbacteria bacterium RIFOXYC2_FULL_46_15]OGF43795.1 MAG: hypothetical protein A2303_05780 [Candidatus Falkowbacteria bacterium RIFOXYB2_FULL_47_14]
MRIDKKNLVSAEQDLKLSSVYVGYLILRILKKKERVSIFDIYAEVKSKNNVFNYSSTMQALIFLYITGLIDFSEPYVYKLSK